MKTNVQPAAVAKKKSSSSNRTRSRSTSTASKSRSKVTTSPTTPPDRLNVATLVNTIKQAEKPKITWENKGISAYLDKNKEAIKALIGKGHTLKEITDGLVAQGVNIGYSNLWHWCAFHGLKTKQQTEREARRAGKSKKPVAKKSASKKAVTA